MKATAAVRHPLQDRSRASLERMLAAAEQLLLERGHHSFTLLDVCRVGHVAIGSIYFRFPSKEELIRAAHDRIMLRLEAEQRGIIDRVARHDGGAEAHLTALIDECSEFLARHAATLRPIMLYAVNDPLVQERGRSAHGQLLDEIVAFLLRYRGRIPHADPAKAIRVIFRIVYASLARELGLGMTEPPQSEVTWSELKSDLAGIAAHYLFGSRDNTVHMPGSHSMPTHRAPLQAFAR